MIDKKARRAELVEEARKIADQIAPLNNRLSFINGAVTALNELITDEENEGKQNAEPAA
jgi:hypothetical protein